MKQDGDVVVAYCSCMTTLLLLTREEVEKLFFFFPTFFGFACFQAHFYIFLNALIMTLMYSQCRSFFIFSQYITTLIFFALFLRKIYEFSSVDFLQTDLFLVEMQTAVLSILSLWLFMFWHLKDVWNYSAVSLINLVESAATNDYFCYWLISVNQIQKTVKKAGNPKSVATCFNKTWTFHHTHTHTRNHLCWLSTWLSASWCVLESTRTREDTRRESGKATEWQHGGRQVGT